MQEPLSAEEKKFYGSIFKTLDPKNSGLISGGVAKPLLEASGLTLPVLGEVWNLSDSENTGFLNQFTFCVAMRLISHAQRGEPVSLTNANLSAPLAKFGTIQVNNTGSGILNSHLSAPLPQSTISAQNSSSQPRITSLNSVQSFSSLSSATSNPNLIVPLLSQIQAANFGAMFDKTAAGGILPGSQAKNIFLKARLPIPILEQIWNLVDQQESGQLTRPQFIVAMHLIQCFMNKSLAVLPTVLSEQLWKVAGGASGVTPASSASTTSATSGHHPAPISPPPPRAHNQPLSSSQPQIQQQYSSLQHAQSTPLKQQPSGGNVAASSTTNLNTWIMSSQQKKQYGAIFDTLDTRHENVITSSTVANFLMTSKLPNQVLASIWELANLDQSDDFSKQEFSIAMYLVQKKLAGYELPEETPLELIQSSALEGQTDVQPIVQQVPAPQSFDSAKAMAAPQRTPSHMDDLLGIFQSVPPVAAASATIQHAHTLPPPAPTSRVSTSMASSNFAPTSSFGKGLQKSVTEEDESSDDDDGPENLDIPRVRGVAPVIPGRSNKPHFDAVENDIIPSGSNYDAIKSVNVADVPPAMFTNQSVDATASTMGGFTNTAAASVGAATGAAIGFTGGAAASALSGAFSNSGSNDRAINNQISQASVDIANYSNQVNSLSKQTSIISSKKDKAQNELNKILKKKEEIANKLSQLRALHEKETQQVAEVQNVMIKSKAESDDLAKELSIVEANYHAEQTKKEQLQAEYDESQKNTQLLKETLGTLNAESIDLKNQIKDLSSKVKQGNNMVAVTQQQIATQDAQNEELRQRVAELNNSILLIDTNHKTLLDRIAGLNDENLNLHEQHTDLSIQSANKNVAYSETLADAAAKGVIGDDLHEDANEEVPTASLDDFDDEEFTSNDAIQSKAVYSIQPESELSPKSTESNTLMSKQTDATTTVADEDTPTERQQFTLPFGSPHSETSSTRNNPSQSERGDIDATTIEQTGPLSSQVLPEGTLGESSDEKSESFEFINHPVENAQTDVQSTSVSAAVPTGLSNQNSSADVSTPTNAKTDSIAAPTSMAAAIAASGMTAPVLKSSASNQTSEVETLSDTPQDHSNQTPELEEFPPIQELEPLEDTSDSSSDEEDFQDASNAKDDLQPAEDPEIENLEPATEENATGESVTKENVSDKSKNPFGNSVPPTVKTESSSNVATGPSMFDDLGLEEAQVEDAGDEFDDPSTGTGGFSNIGFTYAGNNVEPVATESVVPYGETPAVASSLAEGDDWEQLFAGFGNDPNLQPAVEEPNTHHDSQFPQPAVFGFNADTNANEHFTTGLSSTVQQDISKAANSIHSSFTEAQQLAIEELSDMGFEKEESISALKLKNWIIDDASNYLLDKA